MEKQPLTKKKNTKDRERLTQDMFPTSGNRFSCLAVAVTKVSARYTISVADYACLLWLDIVQKFSEFFFYLSITNDSLLCF